MGREAKLNPQAIENVGRYNVTIHLTDLDGLVEQIDAISWNHPGGDYMAMNIASDNLRVVNLKQYKGFSVTPQLKVELVT